MDTHRIQAVALLLCVVAPIEMAHAPDPGFRTANATQDCSWGSPGASRGPDSSADRMLQVARRMLVLADSAQDHYDLGIASRYGVSEGPRGRFAAGVLAVIDGALELDSLSGWGWYARAEVALLRSERGEGRHDRSEFRIAQEAQARAAALAAPRRNEILHHCVVTLGARMDRIEAEGRLIDSR